MREFAETQARFGAALAASSSGAGMADLLRGEADGVSKRFDVYRGNVRANIAKALAATYPVVDKLVGDEFFAGLAREYASRFPSTSGDLNEYGESFAGFLSDFAPAAEIPYLADVARLEWLVHRAHYAADAVPFDATRLATVPAEKQLQLRPRLHPACSLVRSAFPLARIWEIHQPGFDGEFAVDFSDEPSCFLVYRPRFKVEVRRVSDAQAAFLDVAVAGGTIADALSAAHARDPSFELGSTLVEWVASAILIDFPLEEA